MPERPIRHLAIAASAGSGKTFQLAHRYIRLLANGVPPARICGLTFSRKAAGEIFDSIARFLIAAAASPENAATLGERIGTPSIDVDRCRAMLRLFVDSLHRTQIGTLDSFMIGVLRAFPAELGIPPEFDILDSEGPGAEAVRNEILTQFFRPGRLAPHLRDQLLTGFRQATYGDATKSLDQSLARFINDYQRVYRLLPDPAQWGHAATLFGNGYPDRAESTSSSVNAGPETEHIPHVAQTPIIEALRSGGYPDTVMERWLAFLKAAETHRPGTAWPRALSYLFDKLAPLIEDLEAGQATVRMERREVVLKGASAGAVRTVLQGVVNREIAAALDRTSGLFTLLDLYARAYDQALRRSGRLTFEDAQILLTDRNPIGGGRRLSRIADDPARLYIDYRLDCRLDHWLLDEFQDTSDLQWDALENLIDEIIQDDTGRRSFFYVGDIKQAIYGWRGGNARLFGAILDRYGATIEREPMDQSYRSCPAIIETVNAVFGTLDSEARLPAAARAQWMSIWGTHRCAGSVATVSGTAALYEPVCPDKAKPDAADCCALVAALIDDLQPVRTGLDVAVLTRSNADGKALVDALRQACPAIPIVHEGSAPIADNPVTSVILSALTFAAHPGDNLAWEHIAMTPLGRTDFFRGRSRAAAAHELLDMIEEYGLTETVRRLGHALSKACPLDAFGHRRLGDLLEACADFEARPVNRGDAAGAAMGDMAVRSLRAYQVHDPPGSGAVRVMTVHQSKGLGFDVVILPDLAGRSLEQARLEGLHVSREQDATDAGWVLDMPHRAAAMCHPTLRAELANADAGAAFNELCVLYVALTRAKRALYMITRFPGKSATSFDAAALIKSRLAGDPKAPPGTALTIGSIPALSLYETGDRDWFRRLPERPATPPEPPAVSLPEGYAGLPGIRPRLDRVEPSLQDQSVIPAAVLFAADARAVVRFGNAIHALFEAVEWSTTVDAAAIAADWRATLPEHDAVTRDAERQFLAAMASPEVVAALARPSAPQADLWREQRFELILDGQWISGQFDRVTIARDRDGTVLQASIIDFKSNRIEDTPAACAEKADAYAPQLRLYRRVLAHLLHIDETRIACRLVFTRIGRVVGIPQTAPANNTRGGNV